MARVESFFGGDDGDDVAIFDGVTTEATVGNLYFGNVAELLAGQLPFAFSNDLQALGMSFQHGVVGGVTGHIAHTYRLHLREWCTAPLDFVHKAKPCVVGNPVSEIVQA